MNIKDLANLINEHAEYCQNEYQPHKLKHLSMDEALAFMDRMQQSLTHFAMWIQTVKGVEDAKSN